MVDKLKPAKLDSNVWYHLTEGRVDKAGKKFGSMLQADNVTQELKVWKVVTPPYYWQFQPLNETGRYVVRNSRDGAAKQLSSCHNPDEGTKEKTGICMRDSDGADDAQAWQLDQWGSSLGRHGLRFINAANGTGLWLDVHRNNPPFMSSDTDDSDEPSQHWYLTSALPVNAVEYSTIHTPTSTTSLTTTTDDPSTTASPAATNTSDSASAGSSSSGLSTGAKAGIGLGVALAVVALAVAAMFLWRRRRQESNALHQRSLPPDMNGAAYGVVGGSGAAGMMQDGSSRGIATAEEKFSTPPQSYHGGYYQPAAGLQELSATAPAQQQQTHHYELDATPISR